MTPTVVLSCPHLMLSHPSRNDHLILPVLLAPSIKRLYHFLRFHELSLLRLGRHKSKWISCFPFRDLLEPFHSRIRDGWKERKEGRKGGENVPDDGDVGVDDFVDVLGLNLKVNNPPSTLGRCCLGCRCKCCTLISTQ